MAPKLPIPPIELRELVGPTDETAFDNPSGQPIFGKEIAPTLYDTVLDFGCGCGRLARQLIQQTHPPRRYLGIDLHPGMIQWNKRNLIAPGFDFQHHDIHQESFNPSSTKKTSPFPSDDHSVSLLIAWSVFTHLTQAQCEYYLTEAARVLKPDGVMLSTWFLFEKTLFPMMQDFQNTLYINDLDPTNATIFDKSWLENFTTHLGLTIRSIQPPAIRGFAWTLQFTSARVTAAPWPIDDAPVGRNAPPLTRQADVSKIGNDP